MANFKINLDTGNRFWTPKGLGALGMDPNRAIAELIANSLDWRREKNDNVPPVIQIRLSGKSVEVRDNGIGMTSAELQNAIQVSVANDYLRTSLRVRKGMFGMGMKVAALTLGWKITIHTRSLSENNIENKLVLNTRELDGDGITNEYRNNINGESTPFIEKSPLGNWESGTSILIEDLTHKNLSPIAIRDSIQEVFAPEIGIEGIKIEVIDLETKETYICEKIEVPVYEDTKINLDDLKLFVEDEETKELKQIRGWIGLMKTGASGSGQWGLHLFKNNQIIERFHQLPSRLGGLMPKNPHPNFARTYGEIYLDMCTPAFHKVGFDYSRANWRKVSELLEEHIKVIMDASLNYRAKDYEKAKETIRRVQKHKKAVKEALKYSVEKITSPDIPSNAIVVSDDCWFVIVEPIFDKLDEREKNKPWIYHYREKSRELAIVINEESPVYSNLIANDNNENLIVLLTCWAISDCILQLLCEHFGFTLKDAIPVRDQQLLWLTTGRGGHDDR